MAVGESLLAQLRTANTPTQIRQIAMVLGGVLKNLGFEEASKLRDALARGSRGLEASARKERDLLGAVLGGHLHALKVSDTRAQMEQSAQDAARPSADE